MRLIHAPKQERGVSMIESLVALLVLALGILGMAGVQTRVLVDTRTANHRATAMGLINDMTNRMLLNREQIATYYTNTSTYPNTNGWNATVALVPPTNCLVNDATATPCTSNQMAQADLNQWLNTVRTSLPNGDARIFASETDQRQIGIAIAWSANESANAPLDPNSPLAVTIGKNGVDCPTNLICHIVYVQP
jgi:type IV pilus assembly protein PilV